MAHSGMLPALLVVVTLLPLACRASTSEVVISCQPGQQHWVLRVAGPPQLSDICLVQLQVRRDGCRVDVQYSTANRRTSRVDRCAWLQLTGSVSDSGDLVALRGPAAAHHGVGKWTLSTLSSSNLHLTSPDGNSVLYKIVKEDVGTSADAGSKAVTRKLLAGH